METNMSRHMLVLVNAKIIGIISSREYTDWCQSKLETVEILYPRILEFQVVQNGITMHVSPLYPAKTKQKNVYIRPMYMESVIECDYDENSDSIQTLDSSVEGERRLMQLYQESIQIWKAEISGIVVPNKKVLLK